jgi:hypothetical protein
METPDATNPSSKAQGLIVNVRSRLTADNMGKAVGATYRGFKDFIRVVAPDVVENAIYGWLISYGMFSYDNKYLQKKEFNLQDPSTLNEANYVALGSVVVTTISHIAYKTLRKITALNDESGGKVFGHTRAMVIAGAFSYAFGSIKNRLTGY